MGLGANNRTATYVQRSRQLEDPDESTLIEWDDQARRIAQIRWERLHRKPEPNWGELVMAGKVELHTAPPCGHSNCESVATWDNGVTKYVCQECQNSFFGRPEVIERNRHDCDQQTASRGT